MKRCILFYYFILLKELLDIGVLSLQSSSSSASIILRKGPNVVNHPANHVFNGRSQRTESYLKNNEISFLLFQYPRGGADHAILASSSSSSDSSPKSTVSKNLIFKAFMLLNASSKWMLVSANFYGVIRYRDPGAFLCLGCILAFFVCEHALKPIWNQARPHGAPLADPGMPSSHSLGSFFVAIGWAHVLRDTMEGFSCDPAQLFLGIATMVASLRILCGYHTIAQVVVGALLGLALGHGWMDLVWNQLGIKTFLYTHAAVRWIIWSAYITGSVFFIWKTMSKWIDRRFALH